MKRDVNQFRERFNRWKSGELVYSSGRPIEYDKGKSALKYKTGDDAIINDKPVEHCAAFANYILNQNGYNISGDAWHPNLMALLYSGYDTDARPTTYDVDAVNKYNHNATTNFYNNFDSTTLLDKSKLYRVNMFVDGSENQRNAYDNARDSVAGSHTGVVLFDNGDNKWKVIHNMHGKIHVDDFTAILNPNGAYGITAIYEPRSNNFVNNAIGGIIRKFGGNYNNGKSSLKIPKFDDGKYVYKTDQVLELPEVEITAKHKEDVAIDNKLIKPGFDKNPFAMPTLEEFIYANLKRYMPGMFNVGLKNINPLYKLLLYPKFEDGKTTYQKAIEGVNTALAIPTIKSKNK